MSDTLPWGEWRPDVSSYNGQHSPTITNAIPRGDGYGPMRGPLGMSSALPAACRGFFTAYDDDGSLAIFAGTLDTLQKLDNGDFTWDDVTDAGGYSDLATGVHWRFTQFGTRVIAVHGNVSPQSYVLGTSTTFEDLGGSPPAGNFATVVGPFVVISGLTNDPYSIQWSSRNNPAEWTIGTNEGDSQAFRDGGLVQRVAGGEYGLVFQDRAVRRMTYSPGSAVVFEFDVVSRDIGLFAPYSLVQVRDMLFFLSPAGFYMWQPLLGFKAIGKERVDRTFFDDVDASALHLIIGAADPQSSRIVWSYKSTSSGLSYLFDRMVCYDWQLDRWSGFINLPGEYLGVCANPGLAATLESLDTINTSIDALTFPFDAYAAEPSGAAALAIADPTHAICVLTGSTMEVTLETPEIDLGSRAFVRGSRSITDATEVYTSIGHKARVMDPLRYTLEHNINSIGVAPIRQDDRVFRFRNRFPAGEDWNYSIGIEPDMTTTGQR